MPAPYSPHADYIAPARARPALWRLIIGSLVIAAIYLGPIMGIHLWLQLRFGPEMGESIFLQMVRGDTPGRLILLLFSFLGMALGPMAAVRLLHKRRAGTLFGPSLPAALRDFLRVIGPLLALQIVLLPFALAHDAIRPGIPLVLLLAYLPAALTGILVQVGAEELVFRGYLQQGLAARFGHPLIWMGLPAALFAWGHYLPGEYGANAPMIAIWAALFSLLAADLTARTGNLGAAIAFHMANNCAAFLLVGLAGDLDGLALWTLALDPGDPATLRPLLLADLMSMGVGWLLARLCLRV